ncbi:MAG: hypothetical protein DRN49_00755 [Thaumarchaeota archaeon]|nr:MAG: hypothetical protein DRN49_00755 [Nitrososphaerota archaeon]
MFRVVAVHLFCPKVWYDRNLDTTVLEYEYTGSIAFGESPLQTVREHNTIVGNLDEHTAGIVAAYYALSLCDRSGIRKPGVKHWGERSIVLVSVGAYDPKIPRLILVGHNLHVSIANNRCFVVDFKKEKKTLRIRELPEGYSDVYVQEIKSLSLSRVERWLCGEGCENCIHTSGMTVVVEPTVPF